MKIDYLKRWSSPLWGQMICSILFMIFTNSCAETVDETPVKEEKEVVVVLNRPLLGVQRWDMYSGKGATQQQELGYLPGGSRYLKPVEWHYRVPFFCRRTVDVNWVQHPDGAGPLWFNSPYDRYVLSDAMNKEIDFATNAGIDFFIFNGPTLTVSDGWGLHNNLDIYL